ncbi:MAG: hypothetical protein H2060_02430 [Azoarcus sp.]|nr:hypothetical protein [Azoarcus sp.]
MIDASSVGATLPPVAVPPARRESGVAPNAPGSRPSGQTEAALSEADQARVRELQQRDREVRAHELAHVAAGAGLITRGASFEYETGPDGQRYAVAGEVGIDTSPGRTPEATIDKAARIQAAALAPADPSAQDRAVAAQAAQMALQARVEQAMQERQARDDASDAPGDSGASLERADAAVRETYGAAAGTRTTPGASISVFA